MAVQNDVTCEYQTYVKKTAQRGAARFAILPSIIRIIKSRRLRWAGHTTRMGEKRAAYTLFVRKPEGKRPGRPRCRWVDNIKMDLAEIRWDGLDWIGLTQDRVKWRGLVNAVMNLRVL
jgi:hypothetical protein